MLCFFVRLQRKFETDHLHGVKLTRPLRANHMFRPEALASPPSKTLTALNVAHSLTVDRMSSSSIVSLSLCSSIANVSSESSLNRRDLNTSSVCASMYSWQRSLSSSCPWVTATWTTKNWSLAERLQARIQNWLVFAATSVYGSSRKTHFNNLTWSQLWSWCGKMASSVEAFIGSVYDTTGRFCRVVVSNLKPPGFKTKMMLLL